MKYKGYEGTSKYSKEDSVYHGYIKNIKDLVLYESDNEHNLKNSFKEAVEDYIETKRYL